MTASKIKLIITLVAIGLFLIAVDFFIPTDIKYMDSYTNTKDVIGEYQYYNINAFYGASGTTYKRYDASGDIAEANVSLSAIESLPYPTEGWFVDRVIIDSFRIDVFNDILGLIILVFVSFSMLKYGKKMFSLSLITSSTSIIIKAVLIVLPFIFNSLPLCNLALGVGIAYLISKIFTIFFLFKGFANLIQDSCCREERWWLNTLWYVSSVVMAILLLLKWLDLNMLYAVFTVILIGIFAATAYLLKRTSDFLVRNCNMTSEI